jgi:hypothetical protein
MDLTVLFSLSLGLFLSSTVVAALVSAIFSLRVSNRQIAVENVTKERTKWRDKVRHLSLEVHKAATSKNAEKLRELNLEFSLALNPKDDEDKKILNCLERLAANGKTGDALEEFTKRVALLLKHDWERAKWEAKPVFWRIRAPRRKNFKYEDGKGNVADSVTR